MELGCLLIALLVGYIIFAVIIFPLLVMTIFALPIIFPYLLGAAALYLLWKFVKKRA
jgi:hypothetical protein